MPTMNDPRLKEVNEKLVQLLRTEDSLPEGDERLPGLRAEIASFQEQKANMLREHLVDLQSDYSEKRSECMGITKKRFRAVYRGLMESGREARQLYYDIVALKNEMRELEPKLSNGTTTL